MIPPLPDCETTKQPDDRMFSKAHGYPLRVHFDLTSAEPGEALRVARLLAADCKFAAVVHGESDAWPTGGLWPPTPMSQFSPDDGSCSAPLIVDGDRRETIRSVIPTMDYISGLRNARAISPDEENALLCASAGSVLADLSSSDHQRVWQDIQLRDHAVMSTPEMLAVVGLWLRNRHEGCHIAPDGLVMGTSRWFSYLQAVRGRLPSSWRFVTKSYEHQRAGTERIGDLAFSVLTRLTYALRARDELHLVDWAPEVDSPIREALYHLDIVLLMISAAFDAAARAAVLALEPSSNTRNVTWRKPDLLALHDDTDDLAQAIGPHSRGRAVLDTLSCLRNLIHAETFDYIVDPSLPASSVAGVPRDVTHELREHISQVTSDSEAWGVVEQGDSFYLRPPVFVEMLLDEALNLLEQLMQLTGPAAGEPPDEYLPPTDDEHFGRLPTSAAMLLCGVSNRPTVASVP